MGMWPKCQTGEARPRLPLYWTYWCPLSLSTLALLPQWCPAPFLASTHPAFPHHPQTPWVPPQFSSIFSDGSVLFLPILEPSETCNQPSKRLQKIKTSFTKGVSMERGIFHWDQCWKRILSADTTFRGNLVTLSLWCIKWGKNKYNTLRALQRIKWVNTVNVLKTVPVTKQALNKC